MTDTDMINWLEVNGQEIYGVNIKGVSYIVVVWADKDGEEQRTYGCNLRDAIRGAKVDERMPGEKINT